MVTQTHQHAFSDTAQLYPLSNRLLQASAAFWFIVAAAGQLIFAYYIAVFYGGATLSGDMQSWNRLMRHGIVEGDPGGNVMMVAHVGLAFVITIGGLLQLTPQIRNAFPAFHRWNGRVYLVNAVVISLAGLILTWTRPTTSGLSNDLAISLNGVLILVCAGLVLYHAMARRIDIHRRWATRLFLLVSGVWFLRIMTFGWIGLHQQPLWIGPNFDGPAFLFFTYASFLLPLAVYEVYLRVQDGAAARGRLLMAAGLTFLTLVMAGGIVMASMILWLPLL
jgi:hypothetical protein